MPIFTFEPSVNNEEIFRLAHSVNSAIFIVESPQGLETMIVVPNAGKKVMQCRDRHQAMAEAKIEDELASRPAIFAIAIESLSRDLEDIRIFAEANNMRVVAINTPERRVDVYMIKNRPFDGKVIWVEPGDTERLRDLIS